MSQHIEDVRTAAVMPVPSKENDFLGFCMHAVKLQNGDKKVCMRCDRYTAPTC